MKRKKRFAHLINEQLRLATEHRLDYEDCSNEFYAMELKYIQMNVGEIQRLIVSALEEMIGASDLWEEK
jgi:hypothetical protein